MRDAGPDWSAELRGRLAPLRLRPEREAEIVEELSQHLDDRWRELVAGGANAEDATRTIEAELANRDRLKDYLKPLRQAKQPAPLSSAPTGAYFNDLKSDIRYAARTLLASRAFTAVAVVSLAIGIGANASVFSLINALVLRPIPGIEQPGSLARVTHVSSYPAFEDLKKRQIFASTVAFQQQPLTSKVGGTTQSSDVVLASGDLHATLGVGAFLGRTLTPDDEATHAPVAVLSHAFWTRALGGDRDVLGTTIEVSRVPVTVVGVTAPEFTGLFVGWPADITVPATLAPQVYRQLGADVLADPGDQWLNVLGRLAPGQSLERANAQLQTVWPDIMAAASPFAPGVTAPPPVTELVPAANGHSRLRARYVSPLYILMGLVAAVLLIACANVATLLLARAAARQRELAIRLAAGASRGRLVRQLLTEAVLLAAAAGSAGTLLAVAAPRVLVRLIAAGGQQAELDLGPDWRVLAFGVATMLATVLLFGLVPALRATRIDVSGALKEHARSLAGGVRLRRGLVVVQIALSMLLAVGAALFMSSLQRVYAVDRGFDASGVLLVRADAVSAGLQGERNVQFFTELVERVSALPHVQSAAASWAAPLSRGVQSGGPIRVEGTPVGVPQGAFQNWISPRYFETIGQAQLLGRPFDDRDAAGAPAVAIVNETFARRYLGDNPLGKRFDPEAGSDFDVEIIGVVRDSPYSQLKDPQVAVSYFPYAQGSMELAMQNMTLEVRSSAAISAAARDLRALVAEFDPDIIVQVEPLQSHIDGSLARDRLLALLSGFLGAISLLLVAIGLYGVMSYTVAQRTAEIGIRVTLGASSRSVLSMVFGDAFRLVAAGMVIGIAAALGAGELIASLLYAVAPRDVGAFLAAAFVMTLVALLACYVPARRASKVDPIVSLRYE